MKSQEKQFNSLTGLLSAFKSEDECIKHLEFVRWKGTPKCPFCACTNVYSFKLRHTYKCANKLCNKKFNIKTKSIFEGSKIPLMKWFVAIYLNASNKKGISSIQLSKHIEVTQKTAWFMLHRIREMMKEKQEPKLSGTIEADETFVGGKNKNRHFNKRVPNSRGRAFIDKTPVLGLMDRENKKVYTYVVPGTGKEVIAPIIYQKVVPGSTLMTDEWSAYENMSATYNHSFVNHGAKQYANGVIHTNTIEGFWSHFKRSINGTYHRVSRKQLQRYCHEITFRYNTINMAEQQRFDHALTMCETRLKYYQLTG